MSSILHSIYGAHYLRKSKNRATLEGYRNRATVRVYNRCISELRDLFGYAR
jgi:hypothetical protein